MTDKKHTWLAEGGTILFSLTIMGYLSYYAYEFGYLAVYDIPADFISITGAAFLRAALSFLSSVKIQIFIFVTASLLLFFSADLKKIFFPLFLFPFIVYGAYGVLPVYVLWALVLFIIFLFIPFYISYVSETFLFFGRYVARLRRVFMPSNNRIFDFRIEHLNVVIVLLFLFIGVPMVAVKEGDTHAKISIVGKNSFFLESEATKGKEEGELQANVFSTVMKNKKYNKKSKKGLLEMINEGFSLTEDEVIDQRVFVRRYADTLLFKKRSFLPLVCENYGACNRKGVARQFFEEGFYVSDLSEDPQKMAYFRASSFSTNLVIRVPNSDQRFYKDYQENFILKFLEENLLSASEIKEVMRIGMPDIMSRVEKNDRNRVEKLLSHLLDRGLIQENRETLGFKKKYTITEAGFKELKSEKEK
ncbi:MAG: hypothetical protein ACTSXQ_01955 [Alphaproteobacteria bacterium]